KNALLCGATGVKNICLKLVGFAYETGSLIKRVSVNSGVQVKTAASRLMTGFLGYANRLGTGFVGFVKQAHTKAIGCIKQITVRCVAISKQITAQVISLSSKTYSALKNQYSFFIVFSGAVIMLGFGVLLYLKKSHVDRLEDFPAIKALELRLTQTEAQLRHAQDQLQVMGNLRNEVRCTASKLGETEELFKARLAQTENQLRDAQNQLQVMGNLEHEVRRTASKLEETEASLAQRLAQTEDGLKDAHQVMSNLEHEVKHTASKFEETEESLKKRLVEAESKVESIDSIGESLKLTGLISLISKNKQKSLDKIKNLNKQNNDLDHVKEKIRKEVKKQMEALE
ncbi:hypothetical protein JST56_00055, partial [Candidatus Dependentiae bacterium]|nr:hypothetical protein [Candidatus Dependentiae bacterium]